MGNCFRALATRNSLLETQIIGEIWCLTKLEYVSHIGGFHSKGFVGTLWDIAIGILLDIPQMPWLCKQTKTKFSKQKLCGKCRAFPYVARNIKCLVPSHSLVSLQVEYDCHTTKAWWLMEWDYESFAPGAMVKTLGSNKCNSTRN